MSEVKEPNDIIEEVETEAVDQPQKNGLDDRQPDAVIEVLEGDIVADESDEAIPEDVSEASEDGDVDEEALSPEEALIEQLQAELAEAKAEAAAQTDKMQRVAAEFQNSKKRQERQLADSIQRAAGNIAGQLLPVLDDFDLAFGNLPEELNEEDASWVDGFRQIHKKLAGVLEDQGVSAIPLDGEFDPNLHEAISSEPNDDVESGHIIETLRAGYEFKGRVLRPAMVRVAT